jgi:hypothetical protein
MLVKNLENIKLLINFYLQIYSYIFYYFYFYNMYVNDNELNNYLRAWILN